MVNNDALGKTFCSFHNNAVLVFTFLTTTLVWSYFLQNKLIFCLIAFPWLSWALLNIKERWWLFLESRLKFVYCWNFHLLNHYSSNSKSLFRSRVVTVISLATKKISLLIFCVWVCVFVWVDRNNIGFFQMILRGWHFKFDHDVSIPILKW